MTDYLKKLRLLDEVNRGILAAYLRKQEIKQLQPSSILNKLWRVYCLLKFLEWKDAREITKEDIEDYIIHRRKTVSPRTLQGDLIELKIFFRFLSPAKEKEFLGEKMQRPKTKLPDVLTRSDISAIVSACDTVRDRALIMVLWDTGARIDEVLSLNIGDIQIDSGCGQTRLRGKTGDREMFFIDCLPDLQAWLNIHPGREKPDSPLFVTYTRFGIGAHRLNIRTVQNLCKVLQQRAGISKRVHPHAFRHARATDKAKDGYTEMELRIMFGWSPSSNMPATYIHISGADVKLKLMQKAGLIQEAPTCERPLQPVKCPRCTKMNPPGTMICSGCSLILDAKFAMSIANQERATQETDRYKELLARLTAVEGKVSGT